MGSITIIDGRACGMARDREHTHAVVRVPALAGRLEPHQLVRATLPVLRRRLDEAALAALIAPVRAPLCLIFSGLRPQLSADEATRADALSARLTSHLTHNLPMQELVWRAYASWLAAVHAALPLCIVIDDLAALDASSLAVLEQLLALDPATLPALVVGFAAPPPAAAPDARGILWEVSDARQALAMVRRAAGDAAASAPAPGTTAPCACEAERDAWDHAPAARARAGLAARDPAPAAIVDAIRDVFHGFAFDTALRLALDALDAAIAWPAAERAVLCGIAALSAHNRQFFSFGNVALARFLEATYGAALAAEADPERRISLCYRLAVTYCRRLGDTARARQMIDRGLAELAAARLPAMHARLQAGWLHNIDAFVRVRDGDLAAAFACCDRSFAALADAVGDNAVATAELELCKLVIVENALTLASLTGDEAAREVWLARSRAGTEVWPSLGVVHVLEQQRARVERLELAAARALGHDALALARGKHNALLEYYLHLNLSDVAFRLGDYAAAAADVARARALADEVGDVLHTGLALELLAAELAELRGDPAAAEACLHGVLAGAAPSLDLQVEVGGRLARLAAARGDRARAEAAIGRTIDLAADSGALDLLVAASCFAGDTAARLADRDEAAAAYASCFELLAGEASTPARELVRLRAVLGQLALGAVDRAQLAHCMDVLPRLLVRERRAWPLARALRALPSGAAAPWPPAIAHALDARA